MTLRPFPARRGKTVCVSVCDECLTHGVSAG